MTSKIDALDRFCVTNFAQGKERVDMALAASDKAIGKAELATEKRFEGVNEFRETLADQASRLMPRNEYQVQHTALQERVSAVATDLYDLKSSTRGKREGISHIGALIVGCAVVFTFVIDAISVAIVLYFHGR
jgi:hypothetical protein